MIFKCKICGGDLELQGNDGIITCQYCGTKQTLPKLESDRVVNLYDRANHLRRNNEYDKAEALYETILNENNKDAECYWSLLLCKYGVEYVKDPKTGEYIPTCNRTQNTSILSDENYKQALKYANSEQKELYKIEAEKINKIQKGILEISDKEEPFDVFICYKETDDEGKRTQDSVIAQEIYYQLKREGYKVFFSKITLEDKIGESYEPYIFAALKSAKVMLVIGTKKEYFEATWVKNEWSRYLALIKNGEKKTLIPCFKDMDAYDLPEDFAHLQSQDMSKLGFEQDLLHGIKKILDSEEKSSKTGKSKKSIVIISIIAIIIIAICGFLLIDTNFSIVKTAKNGESKSQTEQSILRQDFIAGSGYTFNIKADDLASKIIEKVGNSIEGIEMEETEQRDGDSNSYIRLGWLFNDMYETPKVIGIEIYHDGSDGYVSGVVCSPAEYGSGDMSSLTVPMNLYEEAKKILGSETEEWTKLIDEGTIGETTYMVGTGEEVTDDSFYAGMRKYLMIYGKY